MAKLKSLTDEMILDVFHTGQAKKLGKNTWLIKTNAGYGIEYHNTVVVDFISNRLIQLDTGGWNTVTTKQRINKYLPDYTMVYQKSFEWILSVDGRDTAFHDKMCLTTDIGNWPFEMVYNELMENIAIRRDKLMGRT